MISASGARFGVSGADTPGLVPQLERPDIRVCEQCPHPFDDHIVMPTALDPMDGGIILCPDKRCECVTTWAVADREVARIPSETEIATLRRQLQEVLAR